MRARAAGISAGLLIALALGGAAAAVAYARSQAFQRRLAAYVTARIEAQTGLRVEMGSFHFAWRPLSIEMDDLVLHGRETAGQPALAVIPRVWQRIQVVSLLRRQVEFERMTLDRPRFNLYRMADGGLNLPQSGAVAAGASSAPLIALGVRELSLRQGELTIEKRVLPLDLDLRQLELELTYQRPAYRGSVNFQVDAGAPGGVRPGLLHARAQFTLEGASVRVDQALVGAAAGEVALQGVVANLAALDFQGQYHLQADLPAALRAAGWDTLAAGRLSSTGTVRWSPKTWALAGDLAVAGARLRAVNPGEAWNGEGAYEFSPAGFTLTRLGLAGLGSSVEVRARWNAAAGWNADAQVSGLRLWTLQSLLRLEKADARVLASLDHLDARLSGTVRLSARVSPAGGVHGLRAGLDLNLEAAASPGRLPLSGRIQASVAGDPPLWDVGTLALSAAGATVRAQGAADNIRWSATIADLARMHPLLEPWGNFALPAHLAWPGWDAVGGRATIAGTVTGWGTAGGPEFAASFEAAGVRWGALAADTVSGAGSWSATRLRLDNLNLASRDQRLAVSGGLALVDYRPPPDAALQLQLEADNFDLAAAAALAGVPAAVSGRGGASVHLTGTLERPSGTGRIQIPELVWRGQAIHDVSASFQADQGAITSSNLGFSVGRGRLAGALTVGLADHTFTLRLDGAELDLAAIAALQSPQIGLRGAVGLSVTGGGAWSDPQLTAVLTAADVQGAGEDLGRVQADVVLDHGVATFDASDTEAAGNLSVHGTVSAAAPHTLAAELSLREYDFDAWLKRFSALPVTGHSQGSGVIRLSGPLDDAAHLSAAVRFDTLELALGGLTVHNQGPVLLSADPQGIRVQAAHLLAPDTDLTVSGGATVQAGPHPSVGLEAAVNGRVNLQLLDGLHAGTHATGEVTIDASLSGSPTQPRIAGSLTVADASVFEDGVPLAFDSIEGRVSFLGNRARIETLSARTGGGTVAFTGFAARTPLGLVYELDANGQSMRARYLGVSATGDLTLRLSGQPGSVLLSGDAALTRIALNDDFDLANFIAQSRLEGSPSSADSLLSKVRLDIHVVTGQQLQLASATANLQLLADLRLRGSAANPTVLGRASANTGTVFFAGNRYRVDQGDVQFTNPFRIEPLLDLELSTTVPPYDVTLNISGVVDKLDISYRSDPPLSAADIVNLLATGAPSQANAALNSQSAGTFVGQSEQLLGRALDNAVAGRLQRLFGITQVQVNPNSLINGVASTGSSVTIQQQVSRNLRLTYTQNLASSAQDIVQVEWTLTKKLGLTLSRDQYGLYGFQFQFHQSAP